MKEISEESKGVEVQAQLDRLDRILTGPTMPRKPPPPTTQQAGDETGGSIAENAAVPLLGYRIFRWLLLVLLIFLISLGVFAWMTYPSGKGVDAATLQVDWYERVRDARQSFIITPIFPLLAAVIGYIFGVRKGNKKAS